MRCRHPECVPDDPVHTGRCRRPERAPDDPAHDVMVVVEKEECLLIRSYLITGHVTDACA